MNTHTYTTEWMRGLALMEEEDQPYLNIGVYAKSCLRTRTRRHLMICIHIAGMGNETTSIHYGASPLRYLRGA
jgi:hypothetical protein